MKKRAVSVLLMICLIITLIPGTAFADTKPGKIYHHNTYIAPNTIKDITNSVYTCKLGYASDIQLYCGEYSAYDSNKLTSFKVTVKDQNDKAVTAKIKSGDVQSYWKYSGKDDDAIRLWLSKNEERPVIHFSFNYDEITGTYLFEGDYKIQAVWVYDGVEYKAETTLNCEIPDDVYSCSIVRIQNNGHLQYHAVNYWNNDVLKFIFTEKNFGYLTFHHMGEGSLEFTGCKEDSSGDIFTKKELKFGPRFDGKGDVINVPTVKIDLNKANPTQVYTLVFKQKDGKEYSRKVMVSIFEAAEFKSASGSDGKVALKWNGWGKDTQYTVYESGMPICNLTDDGSAAFECAAQKPAAGTGRTYQLSSWNYKMGIMEEMYVDYVTSPAKITGVKLATGANYVKATWSKKTATGYQVQIATDSKFTKNTKKYTIKSGSTLTKKISKLKKGKKYYVRVRAYTEYDQTKVYGKWSAAKSITCK